MKSLEIIYTQLLSLRLQVDSLIQMIEGSIDESKEDCKIIECNHPMNARINLSTMGDDRDIWQCRKCGKKFIDGEEAENI